MIFGRGVFSNGTRFGLAQRASWPGTAPWSENFDADFPVDKAPRTWEIPPANVGKLVRHIASIGTDRFENQRLTFEYGGPEESQLCYGVVGKRDHENPDENRKSNADNGFSQHGLPESER
jgi:hypothetical protein